MIFMTPIVRVKKVSENKKNVDNHVRFFLYEKYKELDHISNHKIQCTFNVNLTVLKVLL